MDEATVLDITNPDEKQQQEAKKRKAVAIAFLTMVFTTQAMLKHVNNACNDDWPVGLVNKILKSLLAIYCLKENITKVELRIMLNNVTIKGNYEPDKLFEQLSEIQNYDTNGTVDKADLMAVIFMVMPNKYQSMLTSFQLEKKDKLTLEELEGAMNQVWHQQSAVKSNSCGNNSKDKLNQTN